MVNIPDIPMPADLAAIRAHDVAALVERGEAHPSQIEACIQWYARATGTPESEIRAAYEQLGGH